MAFGFNADKTKADVYTKSETYSKNELYSKSETLSKNDIIVFECTSGNISATSTKRIEVSQSQLVSAGIEDINNFEIISFSVAYDNTTYPAWKNAPENYIKKSIGSGFYDEFCYPRITKSAPIPTEVDPICLIINDYNETAGVVVRKYRIVFLKISNN